jgi:hypothetical protein
MMTRVLLSLSFSFYFSLLTSTFVVDGEQRHARIHTGEKPYGCVMNDCPEMFARRSHLLAHIRAQHDGAVTAVTSSSPNGTQIATITGFGGFIRTIPITPKLKHKNKNKDRNRNRNKNHRRGLQTSRSLDLSSISNTTNFESKSMGSPLSDSVSNDLIFYKLNGSKFNSAHFSSPPSSFSDDDHSINIDIDHMMMLTDEQLGTPVQFSDSHIHSPFFQEDSQADGQYNERVSTESEPITIGTGISNPSADSRVDALHTHIPYVGRSERNHTKLWTKQQPHRSTIITNMATGISTTPLSYTPRSSSQSSIYRVNFPMIVSEISGMKKMNLFKTILGFVMQ